MNTTNRITFAAALMTAALATPTAFAQGTSVPAQGPMTFAAFDRDGNGVVTEDEFNRARAERMAARAAAGGQMRGAASAPSFGDFDVNGDGQMSADEFARVQQSRMQSRSGMGAGTGSGAGQGAGMGRGMGMNRPSFEDFDLDGNGTLTEKEFYEARAKRIAERSQQGYPMRNLSSAPAFSAIDLDGNGLVDAQEFATAQTQHRQQKFQTQQPAGQTAVPRF